MEVHSFRPMIPEFSAPLCDFGFSSEMQSSLRILSSSPDPSPKVKKENTTIEHHPHVHIKKVAHDAHRTKKHEEHEHEHHGRGRLVDVTNVSLVEEREA